MVERAHGPAQLKASLTVADCISEYIKFLGTRRKSAREAKYNADADILPKLGKTKAEELTADKISDWHSAIAKAPARVRTKRARSSSSGTTKVSGMGAPAEIDREQDTDGSQGRAKSGFQRRKDQERSCLAARRTDPERRFGAHSSIDEATRFLNSADASF
jgi:hypothetical protein